MRHLTGLNLSVKMCPKKPIFAKNNFQQSVANAYDCWKHKLLS
jgi:hypothetical protein